MVRERQGKRIPQFQPHQIFEDSYLDSDQEGRELRVVLPLPPRPEGLTATYFRACGMAVAIGAQLLPRQTIGAVVAVRILSRPGEDASVVAFEAVKETLK